MLDRLVHSIPLALGFVSERSPHPLQFRLFRTDGQPLYRTQLQSQAGIMQLSLPQGQGQSELAGGKLYRWQVVLVCNPNAPLMNRVVSAEIEVVKLTAALQAQLTATQDPQQRLIQAIEQQR